MAKKGEKGVEYKLSVREQKFIAFYIESGDAQQAVKEAKFNTTSPLAYSRKLLAKPKIQRELRAQMELLKNDCIASAKEIMAFYTDTMRGQVKDQFGLDATLSDRLKAADALAKRQIDMQLIADKAKENEVTINLVWDRKNSIIKPNLPESIDGEPLIDISEDNDDGEQ